MTDRPTQIDDGGPVHPFEYVSHTNDYGNEVKQRLKGMTLRDYFAGQSNPLAYDPLGTYERAYKREPTISELAEYITQIRNHEADAMIAERNRTK